MKSVAHARSVFAGLLAGAVFIGSPSAGAAEPPKVVASIAPVHSLVAQVMGGVGTPKLLVPPDASEHTFALKPSDARALEEAAVVFWVGPDLEGFLRRPLRTIGMKAKVVALSRARGVALLPVRTEGAWAEDDDDHDHDKDKKKEAEHGHGHDKEKKDAHGHDHGKDAKDMHVWLDPANARAMATAIATTLAERDAANAAAYHANAKRAGADLQSLETALKMKLQPVAKAPFLVFHDAYQYFERRFGLNAVGALAVNPENLPGARHLAELRERAQKVGAKCVFSEPQFSPRAAATVAEAIGARTASLDHLGVGIPPGPGLYKAMMEGMANTLTRCLADG